MRVRQSAQSRLVEHVSAACGWKTSGTDVLFQPTLCAAMSRAMLQERAALTALALGCLRSTATFRWKRATLRRPTSECVLRQTGTHAIRPLFIHALVLFPGVSGAQGAMRVSRSVLLAPSLLSVDWTRAGEQVAQLQQLGVEWLHFDAMDGHFVPNLSFGALFLKAMRPVCDLHFDAHLMVSNPAERIPEFLEAGAQSISVHVEGQAHLHRLVHTIKDGGALAGAVLNPATPVETLDVILPDLDYVLVMSVNPGFGGQKFLPLALDKIRRLDARRRERGLAFHIQVDGGVSAHNAGELVRAGVDILVAGSAVFAPPKPLSETVGALRAAVASADSLDI